jgi:hypothetical protein
MRWGNDPRPTTEDDAHFATVGCLDGAASARTEDDVRRRRRIVIVRTGARRVSDLIDAICIAADAIEIDGHPYGTDTGAYVERAQVDRTAVDFRNGVLAARRALTDSGKGRCDRRRSAVRRHVPRATLHGREWKGWPTHPAGGASKTWGASAAVPSTLLSRATSCSFTSADSGGLFPLGKGGCISAFTSGTKSPPRASNHCRKW